VLILTEKSQEVEANVVNELLQIVGTDSKAHRIQYRMSDCCSQFNPWKPSSGRIENAADTIQGRVRKRRDRFAGHLSQRNLPYRIFVVGRAHPYLFWDVGALRYDFLKVLANSLSAHDVEARKKQQDPLE